MIMSLPRVLYASFALAVMVGPAALAPAQEPGKPTDKDSALDSLLEKLSTGNSSGKPAARSRDSAPPKPGSSKAKTDTGAAKGQDKAPTAQKKATNRKPGASDVSAKDKELDDLLEKLGETKEEPAPRDRSPSLPGAGEPSEPSRPAPGQGETSKDKSKDKAKAPDLQGKDKEIDERLEEFTGRKRKKNRSQDEEGGGPLGQIIKEMRDVEQKLGKPETGEDTQSRQKQIVKKIETLIQQMRQSASSGSMAMRMMRQQGRNQGNQQGQTPGANAGGAPPTKPARPSERHAMPGGKDSWGHLPPDLRQEMDNVLKEEPLATKQEMIRRYYLSVAKQKLVRENEP
jgi:hypothetical protein